MDMKLIFRIGQYWKKECGLYVSAYYPLTYRDVNNNKITATVTMSLLTKAGSPGKPHSFINSC